MGRSQTGIHQDKHGFWYVDRIYKGTRLRNRFESFEEAESWLIYQLEQLRRIHLYGIRSKRTFDEAAAKYLFDHQEKVSLQLDIYHLERLMPFIGKLTLDQIHDGTLATFIKDRKSRGLAHKTVNLGLGVVRRILSLAARNWRDEDGKTWLESAPIITMLPLNGHQREPRPITWDEQRRIMPLLPDHLAKMVLFNLNTGLRDEVVCALKWEWEVPVPELGKVSVFVVPKRFVKGRKIDRAFVCNSVAQRIIESQRGKHDVYVFPYQGHRVETMNNSAWQRARKQAGIPDLHIHDLRHTVGMRLREAGVNEVTSADILWHTRPGMTGHYTVAGIAELLEALNLITDERNRINRSLAMIQREWLGTKGPQKVPMEMKTGQTISDLTR